MKKRCRISQCPNCQTQLKVNDNFCPHCGQENHFHDNSMRELWNDFIGSFMNFDGKIWQTLAAIFGHPGRISKSFVSGKRVTYVPPFRLYLFVSFLYLLVSNYSIGLIINSPGMSQIFSNANQRYQPRKIALEDDTYEAMKILPQDELLSFARNHEEKNSEPGNIAHLLYPHLIDSLVLSTDEVQAFHMDLDGMEININEDYTEIGKALKVYLKPEYDTLNIAEMIVTVADLHQIYNDNDYADVLYDRQNQQSNYIEKLGTTQSVVFGAILRMGNKAERQHFIQNLFQTNLNYFSYAMFLLMPMAGLILYLFYWRKFKNYYPHFVFTLHLHTFLFITMTIAICMMVVVYMSIHNIPNILIFFTFLGIYLYQLIYFLLAQRNFYQISLRKAVFKGMITHMIYIGLFWLVVTCIVLLSVLLN